MILLDTDHLSLLQVRDTPAAFALQARLEALSPDEVVTTVITMEEQMRGWLALIHRVIGVCEPLGQIKIPQGIFPLAPWEGSHWSLPALPASDHALACVGTRLGEHAILL